MLLNADFYRTDFIDWRSKSDHDELLKSEELKASVAASLGELSDLEATPPLISMKPKSNIDSNIDNIW
jgi:hypothetical protein